MIQEEDELTNAVVRFVGILVAVIAPDGQERFDDYRSDIEKSVREIVNVSKTEEQDG